MPISDLIIFPALTAMRILKASEVVSDLLWVWRLYAFCSALSSLTDVLPRPELVNVGKSGSVYRVQRGTSLLMRGDKK